MTDAEVFARMQKLDAGLDALQGASLFEDVAADPRVRANPDTQRYMDRADVVARRSLRTLLTTGAVLDLPPEARQNEHVRARIDRQSAEMDQSVIEMTGLLAALSPQRLSDMQRVIRDEPDITLNFVEALDRRSESLGLGPASRRQLRNAGRDISFRLSRQPPKLVIDEYVRKVERVAARRGVEVAAQRWVAAATLEELLWMQPAGPAAGSSGWQLDKSPPERGTDTDLKRVAAPSEGWDETPEAYKRPPNPRERKKGGKRLPGQGVAIAGGAMFGIGALLLGIGVANGGYPGLLTFGVLLGLAGLVTLLVGLTIMAAS